MQNFEKKSHSVSPAFYRCNVACGYSQDLSSTFDFFFLAGGFCLLASFWKGFQSQGYKYLVFKNKIVLLIMASENMP